MKILVSTEPIPAARLRFGSGRAYQPARNREYREIVRAAAMSAMEGREPMTGEVSARIALFRHYKPTARNYGDADNHAKAILDGLNGICFVDDAQIVRLVVEKYKDAANPRAEIELSEVRNGIDVCTRTESRTATSARAVKKSARSGN